MHFTSLALKMKYILITHFPYHRSLRLVFRIVLQVKHFVSVSIPKQILTKNIIALEKIKMSTVIQHIKCKN